jgi:hypothetical protein
MSINQITESEISRQLMEDQREANKRLASKPMLQDYDFEDLAPYREAAEIAKCGGQAMSATTKDNTVNGISAALAQSEREGE